MKKKSELKNKEKRKERQDSPCAKTFSQDQGNLLLKLARRTIGDKLGVANSTKEKDNAMEGFEDPMFNENFGNFVTLHLNGDLRGCIGTLEATESIKEGIIINAVNAAFHDPRFPKLTLNEFHDVHMEISILSTPIPLEYKNSRELLLKLQPDIHGVIITKGGARSTFLPQVWHQLPDREIFLSRLCRKAGLSDGEWKKGTINVMTYTVQYFEE